jgi:hypothetical protein
VSLFGVSGRRAQALGELLDLAHARGRFYRAAV